MSDVTVGAKLEADASGYIKSVGDIRKEVKLAEKDVIAMSEKFGVTSKEAAAAAKRAAELKDQIGDAKSLIDAFNPDTKFRAFGASIQTVVGGFTALTGVMGLLGVESEEVQKTLLKVQSALALSQGIAQLQEGMQAFKNLGTVLVNTLGKSGLIGVAIAGVAALGAAILGVFDGASLKTKELNKSIKELQKAESEASKEVNILKNSFEQAKLGIISKKDALDRYNNGIGKTIGFAKDLNEAEKLTADNAVAYIKVQGLKAQANYILAKSSELEATARIDQIELDKAELKGLEYYTNLNQKKINDSKRAADELKGLITSINTEIAAASSGFRTTTTPTIAGGTATTPGGAVKEKELQEISGFQKLINEINEEAARKEKELLDRRVGYIGQQETNLTVNFKEQSQARIGLDKAEHEHKIALAVATANTLQSLADLFGQQTAAGKILAIASATINTYLGATKAIAQGGAIGVIQAVGVIASGLAMVKKIISVQIPNVKGSSGSSPSVGSVSAPLQAQLPTSTSTRLDRDQLNQIGNAAVRAFVIETDVTTNQERIRRINRQARIG